MRTVHSAKGYTLVELVIALSVISILSIVVLYFFGNVLIQNTIAIARGDLLSEAHIALDRVNDDVRLSANADEQNRWEDDHAPNAPSDLFSWASDSDTAVLATVAQDQNDTILFEDASEYISWKNNNIYFVANNTLYKRVLAAPVSGNKAVTTCPAAVATTSCPKDREVLHNVQSFTIRYLDGDNNEVVPANARSVELEILLSKKAYGRTITADYTTRTVFRND
ncbi:MAG TPA: type II secretion system protein [Candidatus Saccharimonadales bacterium]|nr:type II secretion system protein [Candidatus Saccharimonadales bacterium]